MQLLHNYNPDVLTCLANLSNDEVFTPPKLVNDMLDLLPKEIWKDENAKFLDPVCKTGVFLREIVKRLIDGLENEIPDIQERINHIYTNQIHGIAITEITALLSRRSTYCSKKANGKYSVCTNFKDEFGNIQFNPVVHIWESGKCTFCGASQSEYDRDDALESHAYEFIHTKNPNNLYKNMKFDVIIGNPPYQINDGGGMGTSAVPLYHKFVDQAKKMNPRFLSMIIPARWYSGGKGLDQFRSEMLNDKRVTKLVDYFDSSECFPGVDISGGVCYFLWENDKKDDCEIKTIRNTKISSMKRPLLENDSNTFIRFNEAISILRKIRKKEEKKLDILVSPRRPFGLDSDVKIYKNKKAEFIKVYAYPENGYINKKDIKRNHNLVSAPKVMIAKAYGERGNFPYLVTAKPFLGESESCCTETYLVIGPLNSNKEAESLKKYIETRLFRFLVLFKKNTQNAAKGVYEYVPQQDFTQQWTDEKLYKKYNLTKDEIAFIESMIRPIV